MRIVVDTNVLVSGTFWTGASYRVLKAIETGEVTLVVSKPILEEYVGILASGEIVEKSAYSDDRVLAAQKLLQLAIIVEPKQRFKVVANDPDDDKFVEAAVAGKCDAIVSQDRHLLKLVRFRRIVIVTPEAFLARQR